MTFTLNKITDGLGTYYVIYENGKNKSKMYKTYDEAIESFNKRILNYNPKIETIKAVTL